MNTSQRKLSRVAFIGVGIMGGPMARHLLEAGYELYVNSRTKERASELLRDGAIWHGTAGSAARDADAVITMLGFPEDVESVYLGPEGIIASARHSTLLIDMTTSDPFLAQRIHAEAAERGLRAIDAPVTGGEVGAQKAQLSILVGADETDFLAAHEILSHLGKTIIRLGGPSAGQSAKLANQVTIAATLAGVCEGLTYAKAMGLDPRQWLDSIAQGAAMSFQLETLGPRMLENDYRPGFIIEHFLKDLTLAQSQADEHYLTLPCMATVIERLQYLVTEGSPKEGTQALIKTYQGQCR